MTLEQYLQQDVYGKNAPGNQFNASSSVSGANVSVQPHHSLLQHIFGTGTLELVINLILSVAVLWGIAYIVLELLDYKRLLRQKTVCLELTPPAFRDKTPMATDQLFTVLHGMRSTRSFSDRILRRKIVMSLEVMSSRDKGIRFIARVPKDQVLIFKQNVSAYVPDTKISVTEDYLPDLSNDKHIRLLDFKLAGHFAHSLNTQGSLTQHDPIAYLTNAMTKLEADELMAFQIVLSPTRSRSATRLRDKIVSGSDTRLHSKRPTLLASAVMGTFRLIGLILQAIMDTISEVLSGEYHYETEKPKVYSQARISPAAQELLDSINLKLSQPLYKANMRAVVISTSKKRRNERIKGLKSSLSVFHKPGLQAITTRNSFFAKYRLWQFKNRLFSLLPKSSSLISSTEMAALYHFPHSSSARTENVVKALSRTLPAPISLKNGATYDVILGENVHQGSTTKIGLTAEERQRHVYIVGGTGNGKTTMLLYGIIQDIKSGKGLAVVDPHGDLAKTILEHIPDNRIDDVIYLNPRDLDYPIGLNLLELPEDLSGSDLEQEKDLVTEAIISVLRKTFSEDDSGGHRIEYVLRNAIHTAMTVEDATIFTVLKLLTDSSYRNPIVQKLNDDELKSFWKEELGKAGGMQRVKMSAGVTSKIGRFRRSVAAERMLGQSKSTIDFDNILNSSKILICNFSKGKLGEDTSKLFGTTVLAKLQLAALRREELKPGERKPFYLYVDEFQDFATMPFLQMLSEARKYKLFLTMAEQSTAQQEHYRFVNVILANVGTVICFRSGSPADEQLLLPLFKPYIQEGEINNLPSYNFYARISAVKPQEPLSGETLLLEEPGSEKVSDKVKEVSRKNYANKHKEESTEKSVDKLKSSNLVKDEIDIQALNV